jgi:hypothetical protein
MHNFLRPSGEIISLPETVEIQHYVNKGYKYLAPWSEEDPYVEVVEEIKELEVKEDIVVKKKYNKKG